jgi:hypothetical protein
MIWEPKGGFKHPNLTCDANIVLGYWISYLKDQEDSFLKHFHMSK